MAYIKVPSVNLEDLQAFQTKHFLGSIPSSRQIPPYDNTIVEEIVEEDDGLGYYPDGVKRTLTDEQIRIFRHSEIHALLRERQLREENLSEGSPPPPQVNSPKGGTQTNPHVSQDLKPKQDTKIMETADEKGKPERGRIVTQEKMKVEVSNGSLDYSKEGSSTYGNARPSTPRFMGRRIISYED